MFLDDIIDEFVSEDYPMTEADMFEEILSICEEIDMFTK